jgi:hypothetical protein
VGIVGDTIGRVGRRAQAAQPAAQPAAAQHPAAPATGGDEGSELRRRRDALAAQVTELQWDLGGLAYEMAVRDHFRLDVLVRRAAVLQERDAELAEVERLLHTEESGVTGSCPHCSAPHSRGAVFCWQCGAPLMERVAASGQSSSGDDGTASTAVLDALLAPPGSASSERQSSFEA